MIFIIKDQYFGVQLIIFFSLLNIFINIYNRVNKLNFNPLKLIGSVSILKKNRQLQTIINF